MKCGGAMRCASAGGAPLDIQPLHAHDAVVAVVIRAFHQLGVRMYVLTATQRPAPREEVNLVPFGRCLAEPAGVNFRGTG